MRDPSGQSRDREASGTLSASAQFAPLPAEAQRQVAKLTSGLLYFSFLFIA